MCRLLETIRYEKGYFDLLPFHQQRMHVSRQKLFGSTDEIDLKKALWQAEKQYFTSKPDGLYKCRVVYDTAIRQVQFIPYHFPTIKSLQMIEDNRIEYALKYEDRKALNHLHNRRGQADDVLVVKNGFITDTTFCNLLFFNGTKWVTPEIPLLKGTRRAALLAGELVVTARIRPADLHNFSIARLINALIRFEDQLDIPVEKIFPTGP